MADYIDKSINFDNVSPSNIINELYREAITEGNAPGNYCKIQILGDERVGKTSLRKNLMGETFDPNEPSTIGIDTKMCNVKEVDESWREIKVEDRSEFSDIVCWFCSQRFRRKSAMSHISKLRGFISACFPLILIFIVWNVVFVFKIPIATSMSSVMWTACVTLLVTKHVQSYIFLCRVAECIFNVHMLSYLMLGSGLPRATWSCSCLLMFMGNGFAVTFQTRMGRSVILAVSLLSISQINTDGSWQERLSSGESMLIATGFLIGRQYLPRVEYFIRILPVIVYTRERMTKVLRISSDIFNGLVLISFSICISAILVQDSAFMFMASLHAGVGFAIGLVLGDRLSVSPLLNTIMKYHWLSLPFEFMHGWIRVVLSGRYLPFRVSDCLNILQSGFIPLVIADIYRNHLLEYNQTTARVARKVLLSKKEKLSMNLSIWDFAGQKLYYNTHHTFMSLHAVYIIVFNLKDFSACSSRSLMLQRIMFWLNSVQQHAHSSIILVGTHEDCVDEQDAEITRNYLNESLRSQNLVFNKDSCFFAVDNSKMSNSEPGRDDINTLRRTIQSEAQNMTHMVTEYPIRWRRFYEFIMEWRSKPARSPYITVSELQNIVTRFHVYTTQELIEMLTFFHNNGEIIYDSVDSVLRQFVVLDPQVMIDIMQSLVVVPTHHDTDKFVVAWRRFELTGILEYKLLKHIIVSKLSITTETTIQVIVGMLQAKDLICKIEYTKSDGNYCGNKSKVSKETFVVPSMLPSKTASLSPDTIKWNTRLYIDFGPMLPDAVFLRLMSRCASYSDIVSVGQEQCQLFKKGGFFTLGTNYFFMLRRLQPCDDQYVVEVSIKAAYDWHPLEVLQYLCSILDTLRCRDFPGLQYTAGVLCPCEAPHQDCRDERMMHVLDLRTEMETEDCIAMVHRLCNGRAVHKDVEELESPLTSTEDNPSLPFTVNVHGDNNIVVVVGNQSRIVFNRGQSSCNGSCKDAGHGSSHPDCGTDVYISCSQRDEGWLKQDLIRYLSGPPHYLTVCLNQYDLPTKPLRARQQNAKRIEFSDVFVAVCSRNYSKDPDGRLTFEREVARRCNVPIIRINRDSTNADIADLFDTDEVYLPRSSRGREREICGALDLLLEMIQNQRH